MADNRDLVTKVTDALITYLNKRDELHLCILVATLSHALEDGHTVQVQTSKKLHTLELPLNIFEEAISFKYGQRQTQRVSARDIQHVVVNGTSILPSRYNAPAAYSFQESLAAHCAHRGSSQRAIKNARIALLRRLALRDQGITPDAMTFRFDHMNPAECSWELASMSIEELQNYLGVELVDTVLKPK